MEKEKYISSAKWLLESMDKHSKYMLEICKEDPFIQHIGYVAGIFYDNGKHVINWLIQKDGDLCHCDDYHIFKTEDMARSIIEKMNYEQLTFVRPYFYYKQRESR